MAEIELDWPMCPGCHKPKPREYCWGGVMDCPMDVPPRSIARSEISGVIDLWEHIRKLERRIKDLEIGEK